MKRYDDMVLNKLLDSYENSAAYAETHPVPAAAAEEGSEADADAPAGRASDAQKRHRGIFCRIDERSFPDYYDTASSAYEILHEQMMDLEQKGLVSLYWKGGKEGHILEKVRLIESREEDCYRKLHRMPRWKKEERIRAICDRHLQDTETEEQADLFVAFLNWIKNRLAAGESIRQYADISDPAGFERLCTLLSAILGNEQDVYLRQFSIAVFRDSKIAERELDRAAAAIRAFGSADLDMEDLCTDEIMEIYGIHRNPVWIYMKGTGAFRIGTKTGSPDSRITLASLENGLGVTLRDLPLLEPDISVCPESVLTVENLTSYYQQDPAELGEKTLVIYLGGFAGRQKRAFLKRLRQAYPSAVFRHSGDIDCGGFRIWKALCEGTGISFATHRMDLQTFERFLESGRSLTKRDRELLPAMKEDPFYHGQRVLFDRMMETGLKLEQESFWKEE